MSDDKGALGPEVSGLAHIAATDPQALARERETLEALAGEGVLTRFRGYFALTGPGWLQSAFTLGGGSAVASLYLGAHYGYELLWVQPLAMIVGVTMLAACAHQTLDWVASVRRHVSIRPPGCGLGLGAGDFGVELRLPRIPAVPRRRRD